MVELQIRFPQHELHETLGVVCPHYWLFEGRDESFTTHLNVFKDFFIDQRR
jgi:hypothetical protein